jgi:hypothetical protein
VEEISLNFHRFIQVCGKCRIIYCIWKVDDPINELDEGENMLLRTSVQQNLRHKIIIKGSRKIKNKERKEGRNCILEFNNMWFVMVGGSFFMLGKWLVHLDRECL